jgi:two-component system, chemotaxis family, protein-glutamate methylesterase/glutaminase
LVVADTAFTVACLGASAGGLDAYKRVIRGIPADAGMAIVVINHMRRRIQVTLPEILTKETSMPVQLISEGMLLERNHVYVFPPNCDLTLHDGAFHLETLSKPHGWPNVVTIFLESLAAMWKGRRVAVILSGLDSDGAEALRSIKAAGGVTFAQKPETAKFPSMPQNAIDTGFVDFTLSPEEIAQQLVRIQHGSSKR